MPQLLVGLYIAIVLSAIMSTIDSLLVVASSAITRDFYQQIFRPDLKEANLSFLSRVVTLSLAILALVLALLVASLSPDRTVFWFSIFGWSGIAATFCPMIILSLFWRSYNTSGAISSMIVGFLSVPFFQFVMTNPRYFPELAIYFEKLDVLFPSFILSAFAGFLVSYLGSK